ncbi:MAG TPA: hypothetical protein VLK84_00180 [Longimicrobium sp.]|nr:hypothetical protein [Longimicrobium sp.]
MSGTLLEYAFLTTPSPLQADTGATLTLVVSNGGSRRVNAASIVVTLPVGTVAKALTADATGIQVMVPPQWSGSQGGGVFTFTPLTAGAGEVGAGGLVFVFAALRVNGQPGTATVAIDETAAFAGQAPAERSSSIPLPKFPPQFQVSELSAGALVVDAGGAATLLWTGTPATYRMQYSPGNGPRVDVPVGNTGPYTTQPLFRTPNVVFTLSVSVAVPGQDQPLVTQRQLAVDVRALSIDRFDALPPVVPVNGVAKLTWRTSNAASVFIQPGSHRVAPNGSLYVVVTGTQVLTLIALDGAGNPVTEQKTITADPSMTVNAERYGLDGRDGSPGQPGANGGPDAGGGTGGPGHGGAGAGEFILVVAGLDLTGMNGRVRLASARGGNGGPGGPGGNGGPHQGGNGGHGADGGSGGTLVMHFTGGWGNYLPGQMIVDVSGGKAGEGGAAGGGTPAGDRGDPGHPGPAGVLRIFDDGQSAAEAGIAAEAGSRVAAVHRLVPARSDTLCGYALLEEPGDDGMRMLTLSVSGAADLETLTVPLPLLSRPDGWTAVQGDGATTLTPPATPSAGGATFTFMPVAARPAITIHETAGGQTRTASFPPGESI